MAHSADWYCAKDGQSFGPMSLDELRRTLPSLSGEKTFVYGPGRR